jgi:hypothetical protein
MEPRDEPLTIFRDALPNLVTRDRYEKRLDQFFEFMNLKGETLESRARLFATKCKRNHSWAMSEIMSYMRYQKERAEKDEISTATLQNYYKPIKLFCEMNDITLTWKKITRTLPKRKGHASDRIPTIEEIKQLLKYPDRRLKPAILVMMSSGIRLGAWEYLRWGDITPFNGKDGTLQAAKLTVYHGEPEEYFTFISPEAYEAVKEYMDFRASHGESITTNSWVLRDLFDVAKTSKGIATMPKHLKSSGLKRLVERALWAQGIRKPLVEGKRRHEFQADHGFRKYFKTVAERHMKSIHVELLMGHSIGLGDNYYRIPEKELLEEYLKAVSDLSLFNSPRIADEERLMSVEKRLERMESVESDMIELVVELVRKGKLTPEDMKGRFPSLQKHVIAVQEDFLD